MGELLGRVVATIEEEFGDLPDAESLTRVLVRLFLAALLGGAIGLEREWARKEAGLRTHMLVSLGAALFVLVPQQAGVEIGDLSRVLQGLMTGIGFVGAGAILKRAQKGKVEGLTSAAGIWLVGAIGAAVGLGREATAVLGTVMALMTLALLRPVQRKVARRRQQVRIAPPTASADG